jgi:GT2 family glycosyltransferase/thioesterase domain-containing protein
MIFHWRVRSLAFVLIDCSVFFSIIELLLMSKSSHSASMATKTVVTADSLGGGLVTFGGLPGLPRAVAYLVHGNNGNVENLRHIAHAAADVEIVGVAAVGVSHLACLDSVCWHGDRSVHEMADRYAEWIANDVDARIESATSCQTSVPKFVIGGYSGGGIVALEVAERLLRGSGSAHTPIEREVVLLDALPPHLSWPRASQQYRQALDHLHEQPSLKTVRSLIPWLARSTANRTTRRVFRSREQQRLAMVAKQLGFSNFAESGLVDLEPNMTEMVNAHPATTYRANVLLVASAPLWPMFTPGYDWHGYVDQVRTVVVPGDHHTMALPQNAAQFMLAFERAVLSDRADRPLVRRVRGHQPSDASIRVMAQVGPEQNSPTTSEKSPPTCVKVSLVIATYNRQGTVGPLLNDLALQHFESISPTELEVIVVNDGGSVAVEKELPPNSPYSITVLNRPNGGPAAARHTGIERSNGQIVVILDDDMRVGPEFLDAHVNMHASGAHVVYGLIRGEVHVGPLFARFHQGHIDRWLDECRNGALPRGERMCTGNVSFRRNDYDNVGGFDRSLVRCEDRDLGIRLELAGVPFRYCEQAVSTHHSEHADIDQWRSRSAVYGESDVTISRKHNDVAALSPWSFLDDLPKPVHPLLLAVAAFPSVGKPLGFGVYHFGELLDRCGLNDAAVKLAGLTYGVDYYRGAGRRWGSASVTFQALRRWKSSRSIPAVTNAAVTNAAVAP